MQKAVGDKYTILTYYVYKVGIKRSECKNAWCGRLQKHHYKFCDWNYLLFRYIQLSVNYVKVKSIHQLITPYFQVYVAWGVMALRESLNDNSVQIMMHFSGWKYLKPAEAVTTHADKCAASEVHFLVWKRCAIH